MRWVSDKFDVKSSILASIVITGYCFIVKAIFDIGIFIYNKNFGNWISNLTNGDIITLISVIVGILIIARKAYNSPDTGDEEIDATKYRFYRVVLVLVALVATIAYNKEPFKLVITTMPTLYYIIIGLIVIIAYKIIKKIIYK
ncbi:hypothetical protein [Peptostreptococcus canis]|uniref:Uncharacterized protein n=1 Tax=Peptostreptococcus canis TaxID=1159213 RepID=A0ABR6TMQ6_9FIRM|nr:hypothetical protein [Peptostreptococcus canis]MBC2576236.1 hypothetical protein [Peptostreptococcus canis]MBP1998229.1 hypothetical protein [Peptostreptococcus canis]